MGNSKWKKWQKVTIASLGGLIILIIIISSLGDSDTPDKTPEQIRKEKIESGFSVFDGSHKALKTEIQKQLNDPNSFEAINTKYWDRDSVITVTMEFTAKNAMGGREKHIVLADCLINGEVKEIKSLK